MKLQHIKKQLLTVALTTVAMGAMAQSLNSAYYTEDYKFRHDPNIPILYIINKKTP